MYTSNKDRDDKTCIMYVVMSIHTLSTILKSFHTQTNVFLLTTLTLKSFSQPVDMDASFVLIYIYN